MFPCEFIEFWFLAEIICRPMFRAGGMFMEIGCQCMRVFPPEAVPLPLA